MTDTTTRLRNLQRWNLGVGVAHLAQGIAILVLSTSFSIAIVATVMTGPPGSEGSLSASRTFFHLSLPIGIAVFLFLAAGDHLLMVVPPIHKWYDANLLRGINVARWVEYSVSASIMIVLICVLNGINNLYALIALFGVNASMILFGLLMEKVNLGREQVTWWPFWFGCIAGIVPWIAIVIGLISSSTAVTVDGVRINPDGVPGFVYGIVVSLFVLFNCFAVNQWLQYRRRGRFADYLFGEKVYLVLSLVAKSALAWQIFAGTLAS